MDSGISGVNTNRPEALPATGDFTLLVWMKTADPHVAQGHLFSNNNGQLGRANLVLINGALQWFNNGGVILTENNSLIFDNQWHQVGVMRKGNQWTLLRDGLAVATGNSAGAINQTVEWMIGRMRAFNGNYEGQIADVVIYNHALDDLLEIQQSSFIPGGECRLAWSSSSGFEYGLEWSSDLLDWNLFQIVPGIGNSQTSHIFEDPGDGRQLFLRIR